MCLMVVMMAYCNSSEGRRVKETTHIHYYKSIYQLAVRYPTLMVLETAIIIDTSQLVSTLKVGSTRIFKAG